MSRLASKLFVAATAAALSATAGSASAGLTGSMVTVDLDFPNLGTVQASAGPAVVGAGVEFGPNSILPGRNFGFDIGDSTITYIPDESATYAVLPFNGFVLTFSGAPTITGVSFDGGLSTFAPTGISFNGNSVSLDFSGASVTPNSLSTVDVRFAANGVPEPATWALMIGGFGLAGATLRRRRRTVVAA